MFLDRREERPCGGEGAIRQCPLWQVSLKRVHHLSETDMALELDALVNDFAVRCFRDIADGDYIAARMACRAALVMQFLWASQQAIEKYLKGILLLNRIPAKDVRHDL